MIDRQTMGSWLEGPGASTLADDDYPGRRLGFPEEGSGSMARFGRRCLAVLVDWMIALVIANGLLDGDPVLGQWATLGVFTVMQVAMISTLGGSIGHLVCGMRVVRLDGSPAGPARALGRSSLLALAIPALLWDRDQRGFHDRFIGTALRRV
ncbi:MAG: RDD family protein [Actinomycetota bacterium]